jgi:cytochrome c oxidase subunit 4
MAGEETHSESGGHHAVGHIVPMKVLAATGIALLILTAVTVWVASIDLGSINIWVALFVAAFKGSLVALFFMHLRYDRPFNGIILVASLAFVALFISFALTDTREYAPRVDTGNAPLVEQKLGELESVELDQ